MIKLIDDWCEADAKVMRLLRLLDVVRKFQGRSANSGIQLILTRKLSYATTQREQILEQIMNREKYRDYSNPDTH